VRKVNDVPVDARKLGSDRRELATEVRFWVRILKEHALFIQLGLPAARPDLIAEAKRFYDRFQRLQGQAESAAVCDPELLGRIRDAVEDLIDFKHALIRLSVECQLPGSSLYPLLLAHITREAVHFLRFLESCIASDDPFISILARQTFWLRQMKEHVEFIIALLDPSERELLAQAQSVRVVFSNLLETARDLKSMAKARPQSFNTVIRFTETVIERVTELRDFKAAAYELAVLCRLLSIVSTPLLLDHIRREADKFLDELNGMRNILRRLDSCPGRK
jgi:hypothetical protein